MAEQDVTEDYISWLNDPEINRFLEVKYNIPNIEEAKKFVRSFEDTPHSFFGIFDKEKSKMVGTISLRVDLHHKIASYGYLIGEKKYWGSSAAVEAIALMMDLAFYDLKLRKVWGGAYLG